MVHKVSSCLPAVAEASSVPEVEDIKTVAAGVIVPLVKSVVPPEAEIAVIASVAVFVLVVLISAAPLVAAVGVCEGLAIIVKVFVPVPAEMVQESGTATPMLSPPRGATNCKRSSRC